MPNQSPLQKARALYQPKLPKVFADNGMNVSAVEGKPTCSVADQDAVQAMFAHTYGLPAVAFNSTGGDAPSGAPVKVGVILSGGQAPGGHNVIAGLFDGLKALNADNELIGFLQGPDGLLKNECEVLDSAKIDAYRNTGGFDIIGSGRTKLESTEHFDQVIKNCKALGISGLVVIGGDDSNTNACLLAEYCLQQKAGIAVVGCPKTIDGDLRNEQIEMSFGFDTATKVYSELIGNIQRDANSAKKYWHFIRVMGRSASHIALECALKTQPNAAVISEEVAANKQTLAGVAEYLTDIVARRAKAGKNFGVVIIPEGLIEFIPEIKVLIAELNDLMAEHGEYFASLETTDDKLQFVNTRLSAEPSHAFSSLPNSIQLQLLMDRDPHGNVQVSRIETEKLLIDMVEELLRQRKAAGTYTGKFSHQSHFFGYEGRCAAPSNFDADYCYSLGYTAAALLGAGKTGYIAAISNTAQPADQWQAGGIPLTMMMNMERRHGEDKPVIKKALVELDGAPFRFFADNRERWAAEEEYLYPGPIQYFGPAEVCDLTTETLRLERS
ncbi:MAG: diphosphate--fructose-6-phosphate 1-phosphotransferase [Verrucomicrobiota bacterium]